MQTVSATEARYHSFIIRLDRIMERCGGLLSKVSKVAGMGAFYYPKDQWSLTCGAMPEVGRCAWEGRS